MVNISFGGKWKIGKGILFMEMGIGVAKMYTYLAETSSARDHIYIITIIIIRARIYKHWYVFFATSDYLFCK